ncbi:MAG TPA: hypothetical protein VLV18_10455, partial [Terriglobales bacterium]|nr:hypothetical protein [Terriglobales bacterium]
MVKTRLYYCCDIHASNVCFKKILNVAKLDVYKANVIIVGGDLTGKRIVPIVRQTNGEYTAEFLENTHIMKNDSELAEMQKLVGNSGFYPYIASPEETQALRKDRAKFDSLITQLILERMKQWM